MPQDKSGRETAESVFARIQRRRQAERAQHAAGQTGGVPPEPPAGTDAADSLRDIREAIDRLKAEQAATAGRGSRPHPSSAPGTGHAGTRAHAFGQPPRRPEASRWQSSADPTATRQADPIDPAGATRFHHSALHDAEFIDVDEDGNPLPPPGARHSPGNAGFQASPDGFPRSKTLRLLLKHPEIALLVAVPAASVLLRSAATRKALFRLGKIYGQREVWRAVDRLLDGGTNRR